MLRLAIVACVFVAAENATLRADECPPCGRLSTADGLRPACGSNDLLNRDELERRFHALFAGRTASETTESLSTGMAASAESLAVRTTFPLTGNADENLSVPTSGMPMDLRARRLIDEIDTFRQAVERNKEQEVPQHGPFIFTVPIVR